MQITIKETVPKFKQITNYLEILDSKICSKLHSHKNILLRALYKMYRLNYNKNDYRIINIKSRIKNVNILLKENLKLNLNKYWEQKIKKINPNSNMFPILNKLFKSRKSLNIKILKIKNDNLELLQKIQININELVLDVNNYYIFDKSEDILHVLGVLFEDKHNKTSNMNNNNENNINKTINNLMKNKTLITNFTSNLKANELQENQTLDNGLVTISKLNEILKSLNNKTSAGIDNIPNIILKNLPLNIVKHYCTIINNAINNAYFPKEWKVAIIIPIIKPGKDPTNPYNYRPYVYICQYAYNVIF